MSHEIAALHQPEHTAIRPEFFKEVERQFTTDTPEAFEHMKNADDIEIITHLYLSHPEEAFSLRVSEVTTHGGSEYVATLKDRGELTDNGLARMEIETDISETAFRFYERQGGYAILRKLRARPAPDVTVDWYGADEPPVIEIEDGPGKTEANEFFGRFAPYLLEQTGHSSVSSEALAYCLSPDVGLGPAEDVSTMAVIETLMAARTAGAGRMAVGIAGRSGSGKSTLTREIEERLGRGEQGLSIALISSDDYHRGKSWLEAKNHGEPWQNWDAPIVYDTRSMKTDLQRLLRGEAILRRRFDFTTEEPGIHGTIEPADIILIEGIVAGSPDLADVRDYLFTLPTPVATSIGRRLYRDVSEGRLNDSLGSPSDILRYQIEYAEPAHLARLASV